MNLRYEFLGQPVTVIHHSDSSLVGLAGPVVDETRETLLLDTPHGTRRVSKRPGRFAFATGTVEGRRIAYRPEDRIKKVKS